MKIEDIRLENFGKDVIYQYIDKENLQIKRIKLKENKIKKNSGYFLINGKIKISDGTIYNAILGISSDDSGEMFEAYFYVNDKWISQNNKNFLRLLDKKKDEVFPYKYHLNVEVEGDINRNHQF